MQALIVPPIAASSCASISTALRLLSENQQRFSMTSPRRGRRGGTQGPRNPAPWRAYGGAAKDGEAIGRAVALQKPGIKNPSYHSLLK